MTYILREIQKLILQKIFLPFVYNLYKNNNVIDNLVVFADSKHDTIPYSLKAMYREIKQGSYIINEQCHDFSKMSTFGKLKACFEFMKVYAVAKYVFICDYYTPASSCNKREETKLIQLWHSSGLQKKFGFDSVDDLGNMIWFSPVKNYDLVSVSSELVRDVFIKAWRLDGNIVKALGTSRTDILFDTQIMESQRERFFGLYPKAIGKKIVMWAPTFRGNGSYGTNDIPEEMLSLQDSLGDEYYFIIKLHPNVASKYNLDNCILATEELYSVVDILITDYSSIMYDFLLLGKQIVLYVPDYYEYILQRGMYIDYRQEFVFPIIDKSGNIAGTIKNLKYTSLDILEKYGNKYLEKNDGCVSKRIIQYVKNMGRNRV